MTLCLLYYFCELTVELCHPLSGELGITGLQGLFQGGPQYVPQVLGVGPSLGLGVVPPVGVLNLYRHDVSYRDSRPALLV